MNPIYYHPIQQKDIRSARVIMLSWRLTLFCFLSTLPLVLLINFDPPSPLPSIIYNLEYFSGRGESPLHVANRFLKIPARRVWWGRPDFFGEQSSPRKSDLSVICCILLLIAWGSPQFFLVIAILILIKIHTRNLLIKYAKMLISTLSCLPIVTATAHPNQIQRRCIMV